MLNGQTFSSRTGKTSGLPKFELEEKLDLAEKTIVVKEVLGTYEEFRDKGTKKNR